MMVARALHESLFGPNGNAKLGATDKIVVLYSDDDAGQSIRVGIQDEVAQANVGTRVTYLPFSAATASAVVPVALGLNPSVILLSSNQAPATAAAIALRQNNSTVPVLSSYVNSAAVFTPAQVEGAALPYQVYANAWVDISLATAPGPTAAQIGGDGTLAGWAFDLALLAGFTPEYWTTFVKDMNSSSIADGSTTAKSLWANPYAMAGYVAAKTFVSILERVEDFDTLTWESFIELAESAPIDLPLAGVINWADGQRVGLETLALTKFQSTLTGWNFSKIREIESITQVRAK